MRIRSLGAAADAGVLYAGADAGADAVAAIAAAAPLALTRRSLTEHAARTGWLVSPRCTPYVLDTQGPYVAALPFWIDGEPRPTLLVFESLQSNFGDCSWDYRQARALAAALGEGLAARSQMGGAD